MTANRNHVTLSKAVAHALRHAPHQYGLRLDSDGWTDVESLLAALRARRGQWRELRPRDLTDMMAGADKERFEVKGGRIRAIYGHSLPEKIERQEAVPPDLLFHGTSPEAAERVWREGLRPMRRQYVHLSTDEDTAREVGHRHGRQPVILQVRAGEARRAGVRFYRGNQQVWLADAIPAEFIHPA